MTAHTSLPAKLLEQVVRGENSEGMMLQSMPNPEIPDGLFPSSSPPSSSSSPPRGQAQKLETKRFKVSALTSPSLAVGLGELIPPMLAAAERSPLRAKFSERLKRTPSLKSPWSDPIIFKGYVHGLHFLWASSNVGNGIHLGGTRLEFWRPC